MKRLRKVEAKPGELKAAYGKNDSGDADLQYAWGGKGVGKWDAHLLAYALQGTAVHEGRTLVQELEERGFDVTTLKFSIRKKVVDEH